MIRVGKLPINKPQKRVVHEDVWYSSRTEKIEDHGSTVLFLQRLIKYYSEQILILQGIMSLNLIIVYYLQNTTYTIRKCTIKHVILLNLC